VKAPADGTKYEEGGPCLKVLPGYIHTCSLQESCVRAHYFVSAAHNKHDGVVGGWIDVDNESK